MLHISPVLLKTKDKTLLTSHKRKSEKLRWHTGCPLFLQWCLWSTAMPFLATPGLTRSLPRSLLSPHPSLWRGKGPFRKPFRSFRHSRVTPGGLLLRLHTARLHSMTQGHSAVFPFLKLWGKTVSPLPSSHFERMQRNNMNCKMFFLTLSFATDKSNRWAKKCQQYRDEGWWFQGRSEVFRQNFPTGPGCFHHMYHNSQASLRLRSWLRAFPACFQPHCFTHSAFSQSSAQILQAILSASEFTY